MESSREIWVATYTADSGREGVGIGALRLDGVDDAAVVGDAGVGAATVDAVAADTPVVGDPGETAARATWLGRAADAPSPSFVAVHPTLAVVYAVAEQAQTVAAYLRVDDVDGSPRLEPLGAAWPAGEAVCHVAVDIQGRFVTAACWGDGRVVLYELAPDGSIVSRFEGAPALDPHEAAAAAVSAADTAAMLARTGFAARTSRAHCSLMLRDGRIMTTDLGFDLIRIWSYEPGAGLVLDQQIVLPFWSGPRHLVAHPNGTVLVITEYSVEVVVLAASPVLAAASPAGELAPDQSAPDSPPELKKSVESARLSFSVVQIGPATARGAQPLDGGAELAVSVDARFVYATVRGSNSVTTLRVDDRGHVHPLADHSSGGDWPRHHLVLGQTLLIAHERSSQVTLFALDPETGLPTGPTQQLTVEAPTALIPA